MIGTEPARIAVACGGTAGHVYPGLAIASAWRRIRPEVEVLFVGTSDGFEARLAQRHGYRLMTVPASPYARVGAGGKLRALAATAQGVVAARRILRREGVRMVLGLGGYASLPTVLAAWTLGVPTALHEANAVAGIANQLAGRVVDSVLLGFDEARSGFAPAGELTGIPVREEIVRLGAALRPPLGDGPRRVLVVGGSNGSPFLDAHVPDLLRRVVARGVPVVVRHQVGVGDPAVTRAAYVAARIEADVVRYLDDMAATYASADFVVTSAGASTLAELAVAGLPTLVVPLASAAFDHQTVNARAFAALTEVPWAQEDAFAPDPLADAVASILGSDAAWGAASARIRRAARADAADAVVRACLALTDGGSREL